MGEELKQALRERPNITHSHFRVGVADVVVKTIAHRLIAPVLTLPNPPKLSCREGCFADLLAQLAIHRLDLVISDRPMHTGMNVRGYNHLLLECGVSFLALPVLGKPLRANFPQSLHLAPLLLPNEDAAVRQRLLHWFDTLRIRPRLVAEFGDTALMKAFGEAGAGVFAVPTHVAAQVAERLNVIVVGSTEQVTEQIYAITCERRIKHPAATAISEAAKVLAS